MRKQFTKILHSHILHVEFTALNHFTDSVGNLVHCFVHFNLPGVKGRKKIYAGCKDIKSITKEPPASTTGVGKTSSTVF